MPQTCGRRRQGTKSIVTNMDLAIYCHMQHKLKRFALPVLDVCKVGPGRHEIVFDDPDDVISRLELEFTNSAEASNFAAAQRSLKSIMREKSAPIRGLRDANRD